MLERFTDFSFHINFLRSCREYCLIYFLDVGFSAICVKLHSGVGFFASHTCDSVHCNLLYHERATLHTPIGRSALHIRDLKHCCQRSCITYLYHNASKLATLHHLSVKIFAALGFSALRLSESANCNS
jgi:hypothetical protein